MIKKWVIFVSSRYVNVKKRKRKITPGFLSAFGIATGVMALITVISIMNGFQLGFIEDILEISSYHIRIESTDAEKAEQIKKLKGVKNVLTFYETKTLLNSEYSIEPCFVKGLPVNAEIEDPGLFKQLNIYRGEYKPKSRGSVLIGRILALKLGLGIGDTVSMYALSGESLKKMQTETADFTVSGIFNSGYDDYDSSMIIMNIADLLEIDNQSDAVTGIKLENRFNDRVVVERIINEAGIASDNIVSWRTYNRAFFSALKLEKNIMFILLGLIFLVVSFGIFNSTKRTIVEKQEEIGILRAIGATPVNIRQVFVIDGLIIGLSGAVPGLILGLIVSLKINTILKVLSMNTASFLVNVPVRIIPLETALIFVFAVGFCMASSFLASAKVSTITPQEVLRYE